MSDRPDRKPLLFAAAALYGGGLVFFYITYVPIVPSFQAVLAPVLAAVAVTTAHNLERGILAFLFCFPLINGLPYLFGIGGSIPHAPTALVLFLFFVLGYLIRAGFGLSKPPTRPRIAAPILLLAGLVAASGLITFWRYANFAPLRSDRIYELVANVNGVTAGGAVMSVVFSALSYLAGFAFFLILLRFVGREAFVAKALTTVLAGAALAVGFGLVQRFGDLRLGNTEAGFRAGALNATLKDPNSFGAYLCVVIPLALGAALGLRGPRRLGPALLLLAAIILLPFTGSLIGWLGLLITGLVFSVTAVRSAFLRRREDPAAVRRVVGAAIAPVVLLSLLIAFVPAIRRSRSFVKIRTRISSMDAANDWGSLTSRRVDYFWRLAVRMMADYPLTGVGIGAYIVELPNEAVLHRARWRNADSAENYGLQVGAELGIPALALAVWIFWQIFLRSARAWKASFGRDGPRDRTFMTAGCFAGLVSMLAAFFFHTYLGSYEIILLFWFLAALPSGPERPAGEALPAAFRRRPSRVLWAAAVLVFGAIHLWSSLHTLSLPVRSERLGLRQEFGFHQAERTSDGRDFRWTKRAAGFEVDVSRPVLEVPILASHPDIGRRPVRVRVFVVRDLFRERRQAAEVVLSKDRWEIVRLDLERELGTKILIHLKVDRTWSPGKAMGSPDPRRLGVAVGAFRFVDNSCGIAAPLKLPRGFAQTKSPLYLVEGYPRRNTRGWAPLGPTRPASASPLKGRSSSGVDAGGSPAVGTASPPRP